MTEKRAGRRGGGIWAHDIFPEECGQVRLWKVVTAEGAPPP